MFVAKLTGVFPRGVEPPSGVREPVETKDFSNESDARAWLIGEGLQDFPWPISCAELFSADGKSVWREWHWSHPALKAKNEDWWRKKDPGREERERAIAERRRKIAEGLIAPEDLSLAEKFELENPIWRGPFFAWTPTNTVDRGLIWFSNYWVRHGLCFSSKSWFPEGQ
jgi:hypothetical protein